MRALSIWRALYMILNSWVFLTKSKDTHVPYTSIKYSEYLSSLIRTLENIIPLYATNAGLSQLLT